MRPHTSPQVLGITLAGTVTIGHTASVTLYHTPHHGQRLGKRSPTAAALDIQPEIKGFKFGFLICLNPKLCPKLKKVLKKVKLPLIKKEKKTGQVRATLETLELVAKKTVKTSKKTGKTLLKIPNKQIPGKLILKPAITKLPLGKYIKKDKKYEKKKDKKTKSYITDPCIIPRKFIKSGILAVIACPLPNPISEIG